jgi:hypothetical protein
LQNNVIERNMRAGVVVTDRHIYSLLKFPYSIFFCAAKKKTQENTKKMDGNNVIQQNMHAGVVVTDIHI